MPVRTLTADPWSALADPTRRKLLTRLAAQACSVTELAAELPISRPAVSQHLKVLLDARLVTVEKKGRERLYTPRPDGLEVLRRDLESFWSQALVNFKRIAEEDPS